MPSEPEYIDVRTLPAYEQGELAFIESHEGEARCPYPPNRWNPNRTAWWAGWYDAQVRKNLWHIWRKHRLSFP